MNRKKKIVADTSALVSLAVGGVVDKALTIVEIYIPQEVKDELHDMAKYQDLHGKAAFAVLQFVNTSKIKLLRIKDLIKAKELCQANKLVDIGEAASIVLADERNISVILSDDFKTFPTFLTITKKKVYLSVYILSRLVNEEMMEKEEAERCLNKIAIHRNWIGAAIFNHAKKCL